MSVALKISSLAIRTLSKPIANSIKAQAREHERFRKLCISFAQGLHRVDMRLRLGLLQSTASIDRQTRAAAAAELAKKRQHPVPTVKTEAQTLAEEERAARAKEKGEAGPHAQPGSGQAAAEAGKKKSPVARIRPLSEAKAIDTGASFLSEAFLFMVGAGLILFESWRARRKESRRRSDIDDRITELERNEELYKSSLIALEHEILRMRGLLEEKESGAGALARRILPRRIWEIAREVPEEKPRAWYRRVFDFATGKAEERTDGEEKTENAKQAIPVAAPTTPAKEAKPAAPKDEEKQKR